MKTYIAERQLFFSDKNTASKKKLIVKIFPPEIVQQDSVKFPVDGVMAKCHVEMDGLNEHSFDVFGADSMQALNLASNIEPILERLSSEYDFFWAAGDPYFDE